MFTYSLTVKRLFLWSLVFYGYVVITLPWQRLSLRVGGSVLANVEVSLKRVAFKKAMNIN